MITQMSLTEEERQIVLRALAEQFLTCPGFDDVHSVIAAKLGGLDMYEQFKTLFSDRKEAPK